jgi:hypothetical protein
MFVVPRYEAPLTVSMLAQCGVIHSCFLLISIKSAWNLSHGRPISRDDESGRDRGVKTEIATPAGDLGLGAEICQFLSAGTEQDLGRYLDRIALYKTGNNFGISLCVVWPLK